MKPSSFLLPLVLVTVPFAAMAIWIRSRRPPTAPVAGPWTRPLAERQGDPFPRFFENAAGERVLVREPPQRIVSATIFSDAVLLDCCPPERILALHRISKDPRCSPVADRSRRFSRHIDGAPEEILALDPDLVIVSSFTRKETLDLLGRGGCAVVRLQGFSSVDQVADNIRALGYLLGLDDAAEKLVRGMHRALDEVAARRRQRSAWRVLLYEAGKTAGRDTLFGSLLAYVGARNVADELGIHGTSGIGPDQILAADPDVLVLGAAPGKEREIRERLRLLPGMDATRAYRTDRLLFVPSAWLLSTSHHVARAAQAIAETLDRWKKP